MGSISINLYKEEGMQLALASHACKILDGKDLVIPSMKSTFSWVKICDEVSTTTMKTRGVIKRNDKISLSNLENTYRKVSLESFKRSYACTASKNFDKIPQEILKSVHTFSLVGAYPAHTSTSFCGHRSTRGLPFIILFANLIFS